MLCKHEEIKSSPYPSRLFSFSQPLNFLSKNFPNPPYSPFFSVPSFPPLPNCFMTANPFISHALLSIPFYFPLSYTPLFHSIHIPSISHPTCTISSLVYYVFHSLHLSPLVFHFIHTSLTQTPLFHSIHLLYISLLVFHLTPLHLFPCVSCNPPPSYLTPCVPISPPHPFAPSISHPLCSIPSTSFIFIPRVPISPTLLPLLLSPLVFHPIHPIHFYPLCSHFPLHPLALSYLTPYVPSHPLPSYVIPCVPISPSTFLHIPFSPLVFPSWFLTLPPHPLALVSYPSSPPSGPGFLPLLPTLWPWFLTPPPHPLAEWFVSSNESLLKPHFYSTKIKLCATRGLLLYANWRPYRYRKHFSLLQI